MRNAINRTSYGRTGVWEILAKRPADTHTTGANRARFVACPSHTPVAHYRGSKNVEIKKSVYYLDGAGGSPR